MVGTGCKRSVVRDLAQARSVTPRVEALLPPRCRQRYEIVVRGNFVVGFND